MHVRRRRLALAFGALLAALAALLAATVSGSARDGRHLQRASLVARLSTAQLAGQRIIYSYAGAQPPPALLTLIRRGEAAGVIFFAANIRSVPQLRRVIAELQRANASSPVHAPLLMLTDQEGGLVRRLPGAPALSEKKIGAAVGAAAVSLATAAGSGAGANLASVGINVNLAPVLDVYRRPGDFIDRYQRSYSSNPGVVARLGGAFIAAQQRARVAATAKHFPGLGSAGTTQDTDARAVTLNVPLSQLRAVDELPYLTAIADGVKLVMLSWAIYPALDRRLPAGLSPTVLGGELRGRLGFRGVTITDALGAGALGRYGGFAQRAVMAAYAGEDLLLCATETLGSATLPSGIAALDGLTVALQQHRLYRTTAEQAAARVIALRSHL